MDAIKLMTEGMLKADKPVVNVGDTVKVHVRIKEGERERIQIFEGTVIAKKHGGISETFTATYPAGTPLNINPQLLLDFIKENYGVKVIDAFVIRKNLYDKDMNILQ